MVHGVENIVNRQALRDMLTVIMISLVPFYDIILIEQDYEFCRREIFIIITV